MSRKNNKSKKGNNKKLKTENGCANAHYTGTDAKGSGNEITFVKRHQRVSSTLHLTIVAMLTAMLVVLSLFCTIKTQAVKITLDFIPVMIAAKLYGVWGAAAVAGLGDIVGYLCHPTGPWFPPITITAVVVGVVFGLCLHNNNFRTGRQRISGILSVVFAQLIVSAFVTPLWLTMLYGSTYQVFFVTRLPQIAIMTVIQTAAVPIIISVSDRLLKLVFGKHSASGERRK